MSKYGVIPVYGFCYGIVKKALEKKKVNIADEILIYDDLLEKEINAFLIELLENETLKAAERRTGFRLKEDYILEKLEA